MANIFLQVGLLRWSAAYQPTNKEQQSNLYRLEAATDESLHSFDPFIGRRCTEWLASFHGLQRGYLFQFISECTYEYVRGKAVGKAHFKKLPETLRKLTPLSEEYRSFEDELRRSLHARVVSWKISTIEGNGRSLTGSGGP